MTISSIPLEIKLQNYVEITNEYTVQLKSNKYKKFNSKLSNSKYLKIKFFSNRFGYENGPFFSYGGAGKIFIKHIDYRVYLIH